MYWLLYDTILCDNVVVSIFLLFADYKVVKCHMYHAYYYYCFYVHCHSNNIHAQLYYVPSTHNAGGDHKLPAQRGNGGYRGAGLDCRGETKARYRGKLECVSVLYVMCMDIMLATMQCNHNHHGRSNIVSFLQIYIYIYVYFLTNSNIKLYFFLVHSRRSTAAVCAEMSPLCSQTLQMTPLYLTQSLLQRKEVSLSKLLQAVVLQLLLLLIILLRICLSRL